MSPPLFFDRKGVAPIIATLMMVAIAIVGGILVFVFAQDLFNSSAVEIPLIEQLEITGYNATDNDTLTLEIQNNAKSKSIIDIVYIQGIEHNITDTSISSGQVIEIDIDYDSTLNIRDGRSFKVTLVTGNDNEYSIRVIKGTDTI